MSDLHIQPLSKTHLASLRKLRLKKFRSLEQKVLVEGWNLIEQLLENGHKPLEIITTDSILPDVNNSASRIDHDRSRTQNQKSSLLSKITCHIYTAYEHELIQLTETETPQSIVALYQIPALNLEKYKTVIYLDGIQDPGNLGTIFRIAAAFGFDGIVLSPLCCDVFSPKVIRASLGSVFWLPSFTEDSTWLLSQEATKIGLDARATVRLREIELSKDKSVILVIGSEGLGIREQTLSLLDIKTCIPIGKNMESLNASVAAGIAAYELSQRLFLLT